ncbi:hypothetical protein TSMEX_010281 [Taenia solium]|eukprot:TsM_000241300 transcript=TsM_000241300 gene=TsM_000241300
MGAVGTVRRLDNRLVQYGHPSDQNRHKTHRDRGFSSSPAVQKLKLLDIDPRSPTDGIVRTPIILDKISNKEGFQPFVGQLPFDTSDFESIDGCITEDDSVHSTRNTSALSDNAIPTNGANDRAHNKGAFLARFRRSLIPRRIRDSPSLIVKMRQKEMIEHSKQQRKQDQGHQTRQEGEDVSTSMQTELVEPDGSSSCATNLFGSLTAGFLSPDMGTAVRRLGFRMENLIADLCSSRDEYDIGNLAQIICSFACKLEYISVASLGSDDLRLQ